MSDPKISLDDLEGRSYRDLQQLAKSLGLPSNVKKIYLIQMIYAKKYKTKEQVDIIVQNVKLERQQFSKVRKKKTRLEATRRKIHLQGSEISSTSNSSSPPIINTANRPGHIIIKCSPNLHQTIMKCPGSSILRSTFLKKTTYPPMKPVDSSDRVLRSYNVKSQTTHSQATLNGNILKVIKTQSTMNLRPAITQRHTSISEETRVNSDNQESYFQEGIVSTKCVGTQLTGFTQKLHPNVIKNVPRVQLMTVQNSMNLRPTLPAKRQRVLSGVYPIVNKNPTPKVNYDYIQSIGYRRNDGKISKINALVQKRNDANKKFRNIDLTVQDLINSNIDSQNMNSEYKVPENMPNLQYPNIPNTTGLECLDYIPPSPHCNQRQFNYDSNETYKENECIQSAVYFHKKIRSEQIRSQRRSVHSDVRILSDEQLPRIDEVFSRFNSVNNRDVTQPIYVQVSEESENILNYPIFVPKANSTNMLETLYNFKSQFLTNQPLLQIATTTATRCVYSTPVIATPMAQASKATADAYSASTCEQDSQCSNETAEMPRLYDLLAMTDQEFSANRCYRNDSLEDISSTPTSSLDRPGLQQSNIPDMVEDALEIISQDGISSTDYLCHVCWNLVDQDKLDLLGHKSVCIVCGISILKRRSRTILKTDMTEKETLTAIVISGWINRPLETSDKVCHPCWLRATIRQINNQDASKLLSTPEPIVTTEPMVTTSSLNREIEVEPLVKSDLFTSDPLQDGNQEKTTPEPMVKEEQIAADPFREIEIEPLVTSDLFISDPLQDGNQEKTMSLITPEPTVEEEQIAAGIKIEPLVTSDLFNTSVNDPLNDLNVAVKDEPDNKSFDSSVENEPNFKVGVTDEMLNQESDNSVLEVQSENQLNQSEIKVTDESLNKELFNSVLVDHAYAYNSSENQLLQPARQQNKEEEQIRLPTIRRVAAVSRKCFIANCTSRVGRKLIPTTIRQQILAKLNFYVPVNARICTEHLKNYSFSEGCVPRTEISTFTAEHIKDMINLLRQVNKIDFKYPELMDDNLFEHWFGMTKIEYASILKKVPRINNIKLKLGLSGLLCKKTTGDCNSGVASLFQLPKSTLEIYMRKVRHILIRNYKHPEFW